jgi:GMP synthase (glutamine-hydrolysing)
MKILYLIHTECELPGTIETWAAEKGFEQAYACPFLGQDLPSLSSFDCLIAMGGPQSAADLRTFPYLEDEIALIRDALKARIPVLGFCLGAQLIGEALGTNTERSPCKEIGVFPIELTHEGVQDPLLANLPKEFLVGHWHNDMPGLTKDCVILAKSAGCPRQIIRYAPNAYGFQCHPEMTLQIADLLIHNCVSDMAPGKYVQSPQQILAHDFPATNQHMKTILDNFLAILAEPVSK